MALMGKGALAMWWDIAPDFRPVFECWHSGEHFSERLAVPGFLRGSRWVSVSGSPHYFVMYELETLSVLATEHYRERVNHPTVQTNQVMAHFKNMVRSQCQVRGSVGSAVASTMLTLRFTAQTGRANELRDQIIQQTLPYLMSLPGITGAHLIENTVPAIPLDQQTAEQKLRGGDTTADWALLISGHDIDLIRTLATDLPRDQAFERHGMSSDHLAGLYRLSHSIDAREA
jgi:hypothetical protein